MSERRFISFDLEIAALIPDGETDWKQYRPLGITCYALAWINEDGSMEVHADCGRDDNGQPMPRMSQAECRSLVERLCALEHLSDALLTHNGVGFDFAILAEETGWTEICANLALDSVDTCLLMHCLRGFPVGLDAICKAMGVQGKIEGMNGALAPQMWADGRYDEVLAYVAQDARCTLEVALEIEKHRVLRWVSKSGNTKMEFVPLLLPVREALQLPEPDTSWMSDPIPRGRFVEWMER